MKRRQFISKAIPACSLVCLGPSKFLGASFAETDSVTQEAGHKFDSEFGGKLTNRQFFAVRYSEFIQLAKALEQSIGKDKAIAFLKNYTREKMLAYGKNQAKRSPDDGFRTYVKTFDPVNYQDTLTMEVVENTDTAYELKVTECIWASTFLAAKAGDIGWASVCFGDYSWAEGFNPKIKLVRDKTLMQGHEFCNHRYVWTG
jgi:hypothetical protein